MNIEITPKLADEIKSFINTAYKDDSTAYALVKEINNAIEASRQAYEDHIEDLTDFIQM